jgi:hypothetical protein
MEVVTSRSGSVTSSGVLSFSLAGLQIAELSFNPGVLDSMGHLELSFASRSIWQFVLLLAVSLLRIATA